MKVKTVWLAAASIILILVLPSKADFADDGYTDHPDALLRIITAAQTQPNRVYSDRDHSLYLKSARYIGPLKTPFGTVHVAELFYIRSALRGSKFPARGHRYIAFLDQYFEIRGCWYVDYSDETLRVDGAKLISDNKEFADKPVILNYDEIPPSGTILYQGKVFGVYR